MQWEVWSIPQEGKTSSYLSDEGGGNLHCTLRSRNSHKGLFQCDWSAGLFPVFLYWLTSLIFFSACILLYLLVLTFLFFRSGVIRDEERLFWVDKKTVDASYGKKILVSIPVFLWTAAGGYGCVSGGCKFKYSHWESGYFSFLKGKYASHAFKLYDRTHYIIQAPASSYNLSYAVKSPMLTFFCKCAHLTDNSFSFFLSYLILLPH